LLAVIFLAPIIALIGCGAQTLSPVSPDVSKQQSYTGFPYNPLVYHLDLSILAYQLYGQTLVWPFDPYYEELDGGAVARAEFINNVGQWASAKGKEQIRSRPSFGGYRGPGRLAGFADNHRHDPVVYRYDKLNPWNNTITNAGGRWVEYLTPAAITEQIREVHMCYRMTGRPEGEVAVERVASNHSARASGARDVLLAFEGGTGDKGEAGQPASQSLMGFVLLRYLPDSNKYDIHIAFRGSRSGSLQRSVRLGISTTQARGNPDWITDLGYDYIHPSGGAGHITTTGSVHRGFAQSMKSILPQVFGCLGKAAALAPSFQPNNIYVTGHSLGGGLAQHFVSAALLGDQYGPDGSGGAMPNVLRRWPWQQIKLITFSAPRAGNATWAKTLTTHKLASEFHSRDQLRYDYNALAGNDPSILPRLIDPETPVGYRVLVSNDAVSTSVIPGRKPVGKSVYVDRLGLLSIIRPYDPDSHEPAVMRDMLIASLNDPRIPAIAWRYREFKNVVAGGETPNSSDTTYKTLQAELPNYYRKNGIGFGHDAYVRHTELFNSILSVP